MRIAVVGAGLGGLALAHLLLRAGFDVEVYERDDAIEARLQGYRIGFDPAGLAAVERAVPSRLHPLLQAVSGVVRASSRVVDPQLTVLGEATRDADEGRMFDRNVLRHLLLADLGLRLRFGRTLDRFEEPTTGGIRLHFTDGTSTDADVAVGADGMGSRVRRQLLPGIRVRDMPVFGAIGRTPMTPRFAALVPGWSTVVSTGSLQLMLGTMEFARPPREAAAALAPDVVLPDTPSYVRWVLLLPGAPTSPDLQPVLDLMAGWHPDLRALVHEADAANSGVGPIREGDPVAPWPTRAVTLLGDAAHPAPPGGLGANLAFLDAGLLCDRLCEVRDGRADLIPALAAYERDMCAAAAAGRAAAARTFAMFDRLRAEAGAPVRS